MSQNHTFEPQLIPLNLNSKRSSKNELLSPTIKINEFEYTSSPVELSEVTTPVN